MARTWVIAVEKIKGEGMKSKDTEQVALTDDTGAEEVEKISALCCKYWRRPGLGRRCLWTLEFSFGNVL